MRILYISQYYPPEMGAPAARVSELARHWSVAGEQVTVLTGFPNHPLGKVHVGYRAKIWKLVHHEIDNREKDGTVDVVRTWLWPLPNHGPLERMINYASFMFSAALTGTFLRRADVIIATSPQLLVGLAGLWVSFLKNVPLVFEVRDLWPETIYGVQLGSQRSLMYRILAAISAWLYRAADQIVVVTPAFR